MSGNVSGNAYEFQVEDRHVAVATFSPPRECRVRESDGRMRECVAHALMVRVGTFVLVSPASERAAPEWRSIEGVLF